jgi:hypothetical protein
MTTDCRLVDGAFDASARSSLHRSLLLPSCIEKLSKSKRERAVGSIRKALAGYEAIEREWVGKWVAYHSVCVCLMPDPDSEELTGCYYLLWLVTRHYASTRYWRGRTGSTDITGGVRVILNKMQGALRGWQSRIPNCEGAPLYRYGTRMSVVVTAAMNKIPPLTELEQFSNHDDSSSQSYLQVLH